MRKAKPMERFLSIDPGIDFGWAMWGKGKPPILTGVETAPAGKEYHQRADRTMASFNQLLERLEPELVVCEWPSLMTGERGGVTVRSGSLVKLAFIVGRMAEATTLRHIRFELVAVNTWKGQLSKSVVEYHLNHILGKEVMSTIQSHAVDATGIGLWYRKLY